MRFPELRDSAPSGREIGETDVVRVAIIGPGPLILVGVVGGEECLSVALATWGVSVARGVFGARMSVDLVNDGPVTIVLGCSGRGRGPAFSRRCYPLETAFQA